MEIIAFLGLLIGLSLGYLWIGRNPKPKDKPKARGIEERLAELEKRMGK